jgi:hypothetical protein
MVSLNRLSPLCGRTSAAKAASEKRAFIAALKRCATQNQLLATEDQLRWFI